jgi:hypothetical protein
LVGKPINQPANQPTFRSFSVSGEECLVMVKRKIKLTDEQKNKNEEILSRLQEERSRLAEETRAMQEQTKRKPGRKRKKQTKTAVEEQPE